MAISRLEQETIMLFNEAEGTASVNTCNAALIRQLDDLAQNRPEEVTMTRQTAYSKTYQLPKKWLKIRPSRILSEEQKREMTKRIHPEYDFSTTEK